MTRINSVRDLDVYRLAFDAAMKTFEISKGFPKEERYSLVDQMRRSSRSVCSNLAEGWESGDIRLFFSINCPMQHKKLQRLKRGWSSHYDVSILPGIPLTN